MAHSAQERAEIRRVRAEIAAQARAAERKPTEFRREVLELTPVPDPPKPWTYTFLANYLDPRWASLWKPRLRTEADPQKHIELGRGHGPSRYDRVPPSGQRLFIGLASRTKASGRTGAVKVAVTRAEVAAMMFPGSRHAPRRRAEPIERAAAALEARGLVSGHHIGAARKWPRDDVPVSWYVRFPPGGRWDGPRVLLGPLEAIREHGCWRMMLAILRLWWRRGVTCAKTKRGDTWLECPPDAFPTVGKATAAAWPTAYAPSPAAARQRRKRARQAVEGLKRDGLVRIEGGRVLPGLVEIADFGPFPPAATNHVTPATNHVTLATNHVTPATNHVTPDT